MDEETGFIFPAEKGKGSAEGATDDPSSPRTTKKAQYIEQQLKLKQSQIEKLSAEDQLRAELREQVAALTSFQAAVKTEKETITEVIKKQPTLP